MLTGCDQQYPLRLIIYLITYTASSTTAGLVRLRVMTMPSTLSQISGRTGSGSYQNPRLRQAPIVRQSSGLGEMEVCDVLLPIIIILNVL